jgi:hypothetical protein
VRVWCESGASLAPVRRESGASLVRVWRESLASLERVWRESDASWRESGASLARVRCESGASLARVWRESGASLARAFPSTKRHFECILNHGDLRVTTVALRTVVLSIFIFLESIAEAITSERQWRSAASMGAAWTRSNPMHFWSHECWMVIALRPTTFSSIPFNT